MFRRFRHYLRAQSQRHENIDHLEERGTERAGRCCLTGGERPIVNPINIRTVSNAAPGKIPRDGVDRIIYGHSRAGRCLTSGTVVRNKDQVLEEARVLPHAESRCGGVGLNLTKEQAPVHSTGCKLQALVIDILPGGRCRKAMLGVCTG